MSGMRKIIDSLGTIGGLAIAAMMLLILAEVMSRLFLNRSIEGAIEIVGIFLSLSVFMGLAPCEQTNHHVRVELLRMRMNRQIRFYMDGVSYVLAIAIVLVTTWQVGLNAYSSFLTREVLPGANLEVPVYPAKIGAFIGFLAFGIQLIVNLIKLYKRQHIHC